MMFKRESLGAKALVCDRVSVHASAVFGYISFR